MVLSKKILELELKKAEAALIAYIDSVEIHKIFIKAIKEELVKL